MLVPLASEADFPCGEHGIVQIVHTNVITKENYLIFNLLLSFFLYVVRFWSTEEMKDTAYIVPVGVAFMMSAWIFYCIMSLTTSALYECYIHASLLLVWMH